MWAIAGQLPSSVQAVGGKCLTQRRWMSAPWLAQRLAGDLAIAVAVRPQITQQTGWHPRSSPRSVRLGVRATSDESSREFPGNFRAASGRFLHETRTGLELSRDFPCFFHGQDLATVFPWPRTFHVRELSANTSALVRDQTAGCPGLCTIYVRGLSAYLTMPSPTSDGIRHLHLKSSRLRRRVNHLKITLAMPRVLFQKMRLHDGSREMIYVRTSLQKY